VSENLGASRRLLMALLEAEFPGKNELLRQLETAQLEPIDNNGSLRFQDVHGDPAPVNRRIPVEGEVLDIDGVVVHVLLHVIDGFLFELEVYREDSRDLCGMLDASKLRTLLL
jgi:hypothetical protein